MNLFKDILFPCGQLSPAAADTLLLVIRVVFGGLLFVHGVQKIMDYHTLSASFPDPIGLGSKLSLQLAIFAEFLCSLAVISGFMFRLALIPIIVTMSVAAFFALRGAPWLQRELPVSYLAVYLILMVTGPGQFSLDALFSR